MNKTLHGEGDDLFIELSDEDLETLGASEGDELIWEIHDDCLTLRKMKRLLLVDHHALLHRSRGALLRTGKRFTTSEGIPTTGVFSYLNCLFSIIKNQNPTHVVICYDAGGNARKEESDTYKANRSAPEPDFIAENRILLNEALYAIGLESVGLRGLEADDIPYTFSHIAKFGTERFDEVIIATVDKDLLQCVTAKTKVLLANSAKKQILMGVEEVIEKWDCEPDDIRYIKAMAGDGSDNIAGIKGVGPKTAVKIFKEAGGDIEAILEHKKVRDHKETFLDNLSLVTLKLCPGEIGPFNWEDYELGLGLRRDYEEFLFTYELTQLAKRVGKIAELLKLKD